MNLGTNGPLNEWIVSNYIIYVKLIFISLVWKLLKSTYLFPPRNVVGCRLTQLLSEWKSMHFVATYTSRLNEMRKKAFKTFVISSC